MSYLEELLPEFRKGAKIRRKEWDNHCYLYFENNAVWTEDTEIISFDGDDLTNNSWEFYQESVDWDYIIKNKCLCAFWDDDEFSITSFLVEKDYPNTEYKEYKYKEMNGRWWKNCRPVRKDELTFYEDRKE